MLTCLISDQPDQPEGVQDSEDFAEEQALLARFVIIDKILFGHCQVKENFSINVI